MTVDTDDGSNLGRAAIIQANTSKNLSGRILVWHSLSNAGKNFFSRVIATYQNVEPDVKVIVEYIAPENFVDRFLTDYQSGLGPNLIIVDYYWLIELIHSQTLLPFDPKQINTSNWLPFVLNQVTYHNQIYALPAGILTQALCYNKQKVDENKIPKTLDELITQAALGYSIGLPSNFVETFWGIKIFGGNLFDSKGNFVLEPGSWAKWLAWLQQAKTQPNIILNSNTLALQDAFENNRLAYLVCDSIIIPELRKQLGNDNLGIALLPGGEKYPAGPLLYTTVLAIADGVSPNQIKIALDFAQFVTNIQQERRRVVELGSIVPPNKAIDLDKRLFPLQGVLMEQSRRGVAIPLDYITQTYRIFTAADILYQQVIEGTITPIEAGQKLLKIVKQENLNN